MPIEIRELQINVTVNQPNGAAGSSSASSPQQGAADKEGIINQCIEEVMEILRSKEER